MQACLPGPNPNLCLPALTQPCRWWQRTMAIMRTASIQREPHRRPPAPPPCSSSSSSSRRAGSRLICLPTRPRRRRWQRERPATAWAAACRTARAARQAAAAVQAAMATAGPQAAAWETFPACCRRRRSGPKRTETWRCLASRQAGSLVPCCVGACTGGACVLSAQLLPFVRAVPRLLPARCCVRLSPSRPAHHSRHELSLTTHASAACPAAVRSGAALQHRHPAGALGACAVYQPRAGAAAGAGLWPAALSRWCMPAPHAAAGRTGRSAGLA